MTLSGELSGMQALDSSADSSIILWYQFLGPVYIFSAKLLEAVVHDLPKRKVRVHRAKR